MENLKLEIHLKQDQYEDNKLVKRKRLQIINVTLLEKSD